MRYHITNITSYHRSAGLPRAVKIGGDSSLRPGRVASVRRLNATILSALSRGEVSVDLVDGPSRSQVTIDNLASFGLEVERTTETRRVFTTDGLRIVQEECFVIVSDQGPDGTSEAEASDEAPSVAASAPEETEEEVEAEQDAELEAEREAEEQEAEAASIDPPSEEVLEEAQKEADESTLDIGGTVLGGDPEVISKSTDLSAKEAVAYIETEQIALVRTFVQEDETRKSVLKAYEARING